MGYAQIVDGEGFTMPKGEIFKLACCDCGLVHQVVIVNGKQEVGIAMKRDNRATAARRREQKKNGSLRFQG